MQLKIAIEEQFRQLLNSTHDALIIVNDAGRIILVNDQTERLFGYGREELVGQPVEALIPERFRYVHRDHRARSRRNYHLYQQARSGDNVYADAATRSPWGDMRTQTMKKESPLALHTIGKTCRRRGIGGGVGSGGEGYPELEAE